MGKILIYMFAGLIYSSYAKEKRFQYQSYAGECEMTTDLKATDIQIKNLIRVFRTEAGLKVYPLSLMSSPSKKNKNFLNQNRIEIERGAKLIKEYRNLDVPKPFKKALNKIIKDMEFGQWQNLSLYKFISSNNVKFLKQSFESVDPYSLCKKIIDEIDQVNTKTFDKRKVYYLVFYKWHNCVNASWRRYDSFRDWQKIVKTDKCDKLDE